MIRLSVPNRHPLTQSTPKEKTNMANDYQNSESFKQGSVRTYGTATNVLIETWSQIYGEALTLQSSQPKRRYLEAVDRFADQLGKKKGDQLLDLLRKEETITPEVSGLADEIVEQKVAQTNAAGRRDIDDVSPNLCKKVIENAIRSRASEEADDIVSVLLWDVLRDAMKELAPLVGWSSPARVGPNGNFSRKWQYVCEMCDDSMTYEGPGLQVINTRGPAPEFPIGPGKLRIRVNKNFY